MVTLLEAAKDSERTFRESLLSTSSSTAVVQLIAKELDRYAIDHNSIFSVIDGTPELHANPLLKNYLHATEKNLYCKENLGADYLSKQQITNFYKEGFIRDKFTLPYCSNSDLAEIKREFIDYKNRCQRGVYLEPYNKLPDYVGHLYLATIVKLLKANYEALVQQSMSIFNVPERELFFEVGVFLIDETGKGINVHQDYAYHILGQRSKTLTTSLITFHLAIAGDQKSALHLFPETHHEILHNLTTLRYLRNHGISIDPELDKFSGCITEYLIRNNQLPYEGIGSEVLKLSHVSRYPQQLYILDKYKDSDIKSYEVKTNPGEYIIFDPATLHANGASSGNIDELIKSLEREIADKHISRLSLAIRVMHTKDENDHFLWMCAPEKVAYLARFFQDRAQEYGADQRRINTGKKNDVFYTVLSNNQLSGSDSPYFSVNEIYKLHELSGAYSKYNAAAISEKNTEIAG